MLEACQVYERLRLEGLLEWEPWHLMGAELRGKIERLTDWLNTEAETYVDFRKAEDE